MLGTAIWSLRPSGASNDGAVVVCGVLLLQMIKLRGHWRGHCSPCLRWCCSTSLLAVQGVQTAALLADALAEGGMLGAG